MAERLFPENMEIYKLKNWKMVTKIDRVYVNKKALNELGWEPKYDFKYMLESIKQRRDFRSNLSKEIGSKGYHDIDFRDGPYPVRE
jgi:UDP-glucose 4-epimerase